MKTSFENSFVHCIDKFDIMKKLLLLLLLVPMVSCSSDDDDVKKTVLTSLKGTMWFQIETIDSADPIEYDYYMYFSDSEKTFISSFRVGQSFVYCFNSSVGLYESEGEYADSGETYNYTVEIISDTNTEFIVKTTSINQLDSNNVSMIDTHSYSISDNTLIDSYSFSNDGTLIVEYESIYTKSERTVESFNCTENDTSN